MKTYKSKIGLELIIPLCILFSFTLFDLISRKIWIGVVIDLLIISIIIYIFQSITYKIENENLNIHCAFFLNKNIKIKTISKISETYNILSSPAATSMDRLEICYNEFNSIMISPKNKEEFIQNLIKINSNIEIKHRNKQ